MKEMPGASRADPEAGQQQLRDGTRERVATSSFDLAERLRSCAMVKKLDNTELSGCDVLQIDVTNMAIWKSEVNKDLLVDLFGKLSIIVFRGGEYSSWDLENPETRKKAITDLNEVLESNKIFVVMKEGRAVGFASVLISEDLQGLKIAEGKLIVVDPDLRKSGVGKELNKLFFELDVDVLSAISQEPGAVSNWIKTAKKMDLISYFCGQRGGKLGEVGDETEQDIVSKCEELIRRSYEFEYPGRVIEGPGIVGIKRTNIKEEIQPPDPLTADDLKFASDDPLKEIFENFVIKQNENHAPHTMYGVLLVLKSLPKVVEAD